MGKFLMKCMLLVFVLFVGIVIGMQKANQGMVNMKGYEEASFQSPVHLKSAEDGQIEAVFLGNEVNMHNLAEKKRKLEEMETFNFFSSLGKTLANAVSAITQKIIDTISAII